MSGVTRLDRMRIEGIRGTMKMGEISNTVEEGRVKWYGHVLRIDGDYVGKIMMLMEMPGKRSTGRPKRRWLDSIRNQWRIQGGFLVARKPPGHVFFINII